MTIEVIFGRFISFSMTNQCYLCNLLKTVLIHLILPSVVPMTVINFGP